MAEQKTNSTTESKVFSNVIWRLLERFGAQGVTLIVSIILARLLDPEMYGQVALITVFTAILNVFLDSGLGRALIQKKDADQIDFSTVFYFNIVCSIALYLLLFFTAPIIANYYNSESLTPVIRVLGISLLISGVKNVQQAYVSKHMIFKKFFFATLGGTIGAAVVGILLAYYGFGVWAIVVQGIFNNFVDTVILWITVKWRPIKAFSFKRLKGLFSYGWKLLVSGLIDTVYNELRQLIIGKKYSSSDLAYYNKGGNFPKIITTNVNSSIDSVLLPAMAEKQDDKAHVKSMTRKAIKTGSFVIWPLMVGLGVCAEPLVRLLLTDKWLGCVFFLRIFCFSYAFYPIHTANLNAIQAIGRSDWFLKLEIVKKLLGLASIAITMWISVEAMAYSLLVMTMLSTVINSFPNWKLLKYGYFEQIKDMLPALGLSAVMGVCVFCVTFIPSLSPLVTLLIQVPLGVIIYCLGAKITKMESYVHTKSLIVKLFKHNKNKDGRNANKGEKGKMKKLLILGGSRYLLPVIEKAHELGLYVITCDYLPDNIAHKFSDEYFNISIIDKEAVCKLAEEQKIDGVMSFACDPGVVTASYVAEKLGLPFQCSYESAEILQDKGLFRKFLWDNGFNCPHAKRYTDIDSALKETDYFKWPVIVKPTDSAGSKGVTRVDDPNELKSAIETAMSGSHNGAFIIEDFLTFKGFHSSADPFTVDGKIAFMTYSDQLFDKNAENPYTPAYIIWPSTMEKKYQDELTSEIQRLFDLLKVRTGIYNIETCVATDGKPYIMEVSPRGGGCKIAEIQKLAFGVDLIENEIRKAVGMPLTEIKQTDCDGVWCETVIHSDSEKGGELKKIVIDETIKQKYVKVTDISAKEGDVVMPFTGANMSLGDMFLRFDSREELEEVMSKRNEWLKIELK